MESSQRVRLQIGGFTRFRPKGNKMLNFKVFSLKKFKKLKPKICGLI